MHVRPAVIASEPRRHRTRLDRGLSLFTEVHAGDGATALLLAANLFTRLGIAFYIWLGIFNLMVPAQLWAFANDIYSEDRGKRLFPLIGIGSSLGAWVGAAVAAALFASLGPYRLMLIAAGSLLICLGLTVWINERESHASAIDGFFWRAGDLFQAVVVFIGTALAFQTSHYSLLNLTFVGVWLLLVVVIVREHRKLVPANP